jgi:hypothetical protein
MKYDLTGMKFGRWEVLRRASHLECKDPKRSQWVCVCECGTNNICDGYYLRRGRTQSCGCLSKELARSRRRKGEGVSGKNQLFLKYKIEAKNRGHEWGLSIEQFSTLTKQNCHYCNKEPYRLYNNNGSKSTEAREYSKYLYNGIDRKNNYLGYVPENTVACCWGCNKMKGSISYEDFIKTIQDIYNNLNK